MLKVFRFNPILRGGVYLPPPPTFGHKIQTAIGVLKILASHNGLYEIQTKSLRNL